MLSLWQYSHAEVCVASARAFVLLVEKKAHGFEWSTSARLATGEALKAFGPCSGDACPVVLQFFKI